MSLYDCKVHHNNKKSMLADELGIKPIFYTYSVPHLKLEHVFKTLLKEKTGYDVPLSIGYDAQIKRAYIEFDREWIDMLSADTYDDFNDRLFLGMQTDDDYKFSNLDIMLKHLFCDDVGVGTVSERTKRGNFSVKVHLPIKDNAFI